MSTNCSQLIHDACRCVLEERFRDLADLIQAALSWKTTKGVMEVSGPIAEQCIHIDSGFKETVTHIRRKSEKESERQ